MKLAGVGTLLLSAMFAGCGGQSGSDGSNTSGSKAATGNAVSNTTTLALEPNSVTIGYLPNIVLPQPLIGIEEGEFTRRINGVAFKDKTFGSGPSALEALRSGVIDIAYTGPYPPIKAFIKDGDVVLLGGCATGGTALSVAKNSPIKTVQDLKGKTVAVNQSGSTVDALVRHKLLEAGLQPDADVKIVAVEPALQADALKDGSVDAVAAPAPWPSYVVVKGGGRTLVDDKAMLANGDYLQGVYFTTKRFVQANPNFVRRFVAVNRAIIDDLNANRVKGDARVLAAWSKASGKKLDPAVAQAAFKTIRFTSEAAQKTLQRDADIAAQTGALKKKGDLTGFIYNPSAP